MKNEGYTLIELLIVFSIIGILLGVGIVAYNDFNKRQTVKGAALTLKNDLRAAQNKALAGEKNCNVGVCGGTVAGCGNDASEKALDSWNVSFSANSYTIYGHCGGSGAAGVDFNQNTLPLPTNISLSWSPPAVNPLKFKVLAQGVDTGGTICLSGFSKLYKLLISVSGEIKDEGFVGSCP